MESENLVFFSIPYESGWKAYVNGKEVKIEKVNVGFMAVLAPEGDCEITFVYTTPGLYSGCIISGIAIIIAAIYIIICQTLRILKPQKWIVEYPEGLELNKRFEEYDINDSEIEKQTDSDEIDEYYKALNSHDDAQYQTSFEGGFTVDTTILDDIITNKETEE